MFIERQMIQPGYHPGPGHVVARCCEGAHLRPAVDQVLEIAVIAVLGPANVANAATCIGVPRLLASSPPAVVGLEQA
jgi:hypothetical protein